MSTQSTGTGQTGQTGQTGETSRDRILDAAEELFREQGYRAVSLLDIARAVSMKKPSLYHHFPDGKEEIFLTVYQRMFARMGSALDDCLRNVSVDINDGENLLEQGLLAAGKWFLERPPMFLLAMLHHDMPGLGEETQKQLVRSSYSVIMGPIVELVGRAGERGDVGDVHPHIVAGGFLAILEGTIIAARAGFGHDVAAMVQESVRMIVFGAAAGKKAGETSDE